MRGVFEVVGAFTDHNEEVITWKGENFFKACDETVVQQSDGSTTGCVKRKDHPGDIHEDYDGVRNGHPKGRYVVVVSVPLKESRDGFEEVHEVMQGLKAQLGHKENLLIYNAIRETADQLIMILEGDG